MQRVINVWNQWDGYLEKRDASDLGDFTPEGKLRNAGNANYTCIAERYKRHGGGCGNPNPYCAMGVSEAFVEAYGPEAATKLLCGGLFHYCPTGAARFQAANRLYATPSPGDVVFFHNGTRFYHTGLVIRTDEAKGTFTTAEANTSSAPGIVVANGGAVRVGKVYAMEAFPKTRFGRPDYAGILDPALTKEQVKPPVGWIYDSNRQNWRYRYGDGNYPKNDWFKAYCASDKKYHWFLADQEGWLLTGRQEFKGTQYYLEEAGPLFGACMKTDENGVLSYMDA